MSRRNDSLSMWLFQSSAKLREVSFFHLASGSATSGFDLIHCDETRRHFRRRTRSAKFVGRVAAGSSVLPGRPHARGMPQAACPLEQSRSVRVYHRV